MWFCTPCPLFYFVLVYSYQLCLQYIPFCAKGGQMQFSSHWWYMSDNFILVVSFLNKRWINCTSPLSPAIPTSGAQWLSEDSDCGGFWRFWGQPTFLLAGTGSTVRSKSHHTGGVILWNFLKRHSLDSKIRRIINTQLRASQWLLNFYFLALHVIVYHRNHPWVIVSDNLKMFLD